MLAVQLPDEGAEARNLFFAEGLSNALLEFVTGVHVHAVATFERRRGEGDREHVASHRGVSEAASTIRAARVSIRRDPRRLRNDRVTPIAIALWWGFYGPIGSSVSGSRAGRWVTLPPKKSFMLARPSRSPP